MTRPELSAIVIVYNGMRFLPGCLGTLVADLEGLQHEIIVVDNGSADGSRSFIEKNFPCVRIICNKSNLGFARAVNIGLGEANGEYLYVLNQDLRFKHGGTRALLARLKAEPSIGLIGPKFVSFNGRVQKSARSFPGIRHVWYEALLLSRLFPNHREFSGWRMGWFDHEHEIVVDQPMGAAMMIPRRVVEQVGRLDESFPLFFNDVDYCRRVQQAGFKLVYCPQAVVEHYVGGTTRLFPMKAVWESHTSMYRYLRKYSRWYQRPALWVTGLLLYAGVVPATLARLLNSRSTSEVSSSSSAQNLRP